MAATDQHYRNQKTLDIIFGVSCGALLLSTLWMFWQDYNREFKSVQRTFRDVEASAAQRDMIDKMPDASIVGDKREKLRQARADLEYEQNQLAPLDRKLTAQYEQADINYRNIKADYDAAMSAYNIAIDDVGKVPLEGPQHKSLLAVVETKKKDLDRVEGKLATAKGELDAIELNIRTDIRARLDLRERQVAAADEDLKRTTGIFDRFAKQAAQRTWTWGDEFRALPIVDGFESPLKIKQLWLPDLTIDYGGFRDVPRFDRCNSCHLGIERGNFDKATLTKLGDKQESQRLTTKLTNARKMLEKRVAAGESLGFSPDDMPGERPASTTWLSLLVVLCVLVGAGTLGILERSWQLAVRVLLAGLIVTVGSTFALAFFAPKNPIVKTVPLKEGQVNQFCAHPRLDLFVDSNSPHPMEKFGCTICHAGQGSATDFLNAVHTPDGTKQEHGWKKKYGWEAQHAGEFPPNYHWDFPMLPQRFVESSCLKCHHQVTDLIRNGVKEEAPKLLRGYNLVRENGCFGCHEIQGVKSGRWIGPDMRLEPAPALDWLSPADQEKAKSDPANPVGTHRKVGPSLRRLAEKTNEEWLRKWILDPRGFRDDTRMPHFYNLSTNNEKALPDDQKGFPAAEIHSIAFYLTQESKQHLQGKDYYREVLLRGKNNLTQIQATLAKDALSDREYKDLLDVSKRFVDLALLSAPTRATAINAHGARQRQLQDRIQELHRKILGGGPDEALNVAKSELTSSISELNTVTLALEKAAIPVPIAERITTDDGSALALPEKDGDSNVGRRLFTEKGCLACHAHQGTTTSDTANKTPPVHSEANFGPELSRIADKLAPAAANTTARRWLVQWLVNPNVYHPRTRMPVTHLSAAEANDIASWILSQKTKWTGNDPAEPKDGDLRALARLHLSRAPGFTKKDVEDFLPEKGEMKGISKDRADALPRDADERELAEGVVNTDKLKWYIGKRGVGRLGCFGCHDIPGFEVAKPIGTGLNDWGKKDHDKLAFEDGEAFAKEHYTIVPSRWTRRQAESQLLALWSKGSETLPDDQKAEFRKWLDAFTTKDKPKDVTQESVQAASGVRAAAEAALVNGDAAELKRLKKALDPATQRRIADLAKMKLDKGFADSKDKKEYEELHPLQFFEASGGHAPMEQAFFDLLTHHHQQREGFLNLKLMEPRSYDFNRLKAWDDRLRMPQFKFARSRKKAGETDVQHRARMEVEEAEAREAVMTFILGLVAEPVPLKYVNVPKAERAQEVTGRQVLDKYNCAGCHQVRPGVYEFNRDEVLKSLENPTFLAGLQGNKTDDYHFPNTTAWVGPTPTGDRLSAMGYLDPKKTEEAQTVEGLEGTVAISLTDAFRFLGSDRLPKDVPAGADLYLPRGKFSIHEPLGGMTWTQAMVPYLTAKNKDKYAKPLAHLPPPLNREGERVQPDWLYSFLLNPGVIRPESYLILRMPKFNMSPEESRALVNYFSSVARTTNPGQGVTAPFVHVPQRDPEFWKHAAEEYLQRVNGVEADIKRVKEEIQKAEAAAKDPKVKLARSVEDLKKELTFLEQRAAIAKEQLAEKPPAKATVTDLYSRQAYKLLTNKDLCLKCHPIGSIQIEGAQGPNLALSSQRLRPEWMEQFISNPKRLLPYDPVMPSNFPNKADPLQWIEQKSFTGTPHQQTRAVRDILMDPARLNDLLQHMPPPALPKPGDGK